MVNFMEQIRRKDMDDFTGDSPWRNGQRHMGEISWVFDANIFTSRWDKEQLTTVMKCKHSMRQTSVMNRLGWWEHDGNIRSYVDDNSSPLLPTKPRECIRRDLICVKWGSDFQLLIFWTFQLMVNREFCVKKKTWTAENPRVLLEIPWIWGPSLPHQKFGAKKNPRKHRPHPGRFCRFPSISRTLMGGLKNCSTHQLQQKAPRKLRLVCSWGLLRFAAINMNACCPCMGCLW